MNDEVLEKERIADLETLRRADENLRLPAIAPRQDFPIETLAPQARLQAKRVKGHARLLHFFADRPGPVDADHGPLELGREVPDQVQHHLLGAADRQRVCEIDDARPAMDHDACR